MRQFLAAFAAVALIPGAGSLQAASLARGNAAGHVIVNAPAVRSVSVVPAQGRAEIVIGVDASVDVDDFALESPNRVVVDLKGAVLSSAPRYDRQMRGGIINVRAAMFKPNVVRVVIEMDQPRAYEVTRKDGEVRIAVATSSSNFTAWYSDDSQKPAATEYAASAPAAAPAQAQPAQVQKAPEPVDYPDVKPSSDISRRDAEAPSAEPMKLSKASAQSDQPRITVTYQDADIRDVIAAFAAFSGRTIVVGKDVQGTITAEIKNQPWDVALRAILQGQGLAAAEDPISGIITVDSYKNIAAKQASEPLVTQMVAVNYAKAASLVPTLSGLLARDCTPGS